MTHGIDIRIARNSLFNIARTLASIPILLALTPYIIHRIGAEEFGIWALVGVISSYAQLGDFGITDSLIRFIAEYKTRNEVDRINRVINTAIVLYTVLGIGTFLIFIRFLPFIVRDLLAVPERLVAGVTHIFTLSIAAFFINMGFGVFNALIIGFQRLDLSNLVSLGSVLMTAAGTVLVLENGYGLPGLVYNNMVTAAFVVICNIWISKSLFPKMRLVPWRLSDRETFRNVFSFSWKIQVTNITQLMIFQIDRIVISHYVGVVAVGYYEIANRIAAPARTFIASVFTPMIPAASELNASASDELVAGLYRRSFKYMCMIAVPFLVLVVALAHPFVEAWMGPGYGVSAYTLQFLAIAYLLNLLTGPGGFLLSGINKPVPSMKASLVAGVLNLFLCLALASTVGYYGVIVGITTSILVGGIYFICLFHRNVSGLPLSLYPTSLGRPVFAAAGGSAVAASISGLWHTPTFLSVAIAGVAGGVLVVIILTTGSYLDEYDRTTFRKLIPFGRIQI